MAGLHGITVTLYEKINVGVDEFNMNIYEPKPVQIEDVLVAPASSDDVISTTNLYGKKVVYTLGIPKGNTNNWQDSTVEFFGQKFRTFGIPQEGIEDLIPLRWNKKVYCERYE